MLYIFIKTTLFFPLCNLALLVMLCKVMSFLATFIKPTRSKRLAFTDICFKLNSYFCYLRLIIIYQKSSYKHNEHLKKTSVFMYPHILWNLINLGYKCTCIKPLQFITTVTDTYLIIFCFVLSFGHYFNEWKDY